MILDRVCRCLDLFLWRQRLNVRNPARTSHILVATGRCRGLELEFILLFLLEGELLTPDGAIYWSNSVDWVMLPEVEEKSKTRHGLDQRRRGGWWIASWSQDPIEGRLKREWRKQIYCLDGIHSLEWQEALAAVCISVGTSNRGPPGTSDDSAIWTDHAVGSKRLNREINALYYYSFLKNDALYYFECGIIELELNWQSVSYFSLRKV